MGGAYNWEGRVEIYWMGEWGTVSASSTSWAVAEAEVVCRQLGHSIDCESSVVQINVSIISKRARIAYSTAGISFRLCTSLLWLLW